MTREMPGELGGLRENLRTVDRNTEVGCPSFVNLQRKQDISEWRVYNYITVLAAIISKMETMSRVYPVIIRRNLGTLELEYHLLWFLVSCLISGKVSVSRMEKVWQMPSFIPN